MSTSNDYNGNRLINVTESIGNRPDYDLMEFKKRTTTLQNYTYNGNGNLTKDLHKNITNIQYNFLNLPNTVSIDEKTINYVYDASG